MLHVVEGKDHIQEMLAAIAQFVGLKTKLFYSADSYLKYLKSDDYIPPKALIADIYLPGLMGCTICNPLKSKYPDVKFVVMSGFMERCDTRCCKRHQADGLIDHYLQKPFKMEELIELLEGIR